MRAGRGVRKEHERGGQAAFILVKIVLSDPGGVEAEAVACTICSMPRRYRSGGAARSSTRVKKPSRSEVMKSPALLETGASRFVNRSIPTMQQRKHPMTLPTPTFDHVVVNARDGLDEAHAAYTALGFTLTPARASLAWVDQSPGHLRHRLPRIARPTARHCTARPGRRSNRPQRPGVRHRRFRRRSSALTAAGVPVTPVNEFTRPVDLGDGTSRDATFRTVHVQPGAERAGPAVFLPPFHPRPGLARRMAAARQRHDRHRARGHRLG